MLWLRDVCVFVSLCDVCVCWSDCLSTFLFLHHFHFSPRPLSLSLCARAVACVCVRARSLVCVRARTRACVRANTFKHKHVGVALSHALRSEGT